MCSSSLQSVIGDLNIRPDRPLRVRTSGRSPLVSPMHERRLGSALVIKFQLVLAAVDGHSAGFWAWQQVAASVPACRAAYVSCSGGLAQHVVRTHSSPRASSMPRTSMPSDAARDLVRVRCGDPAEHAQTEL